LVVSLNLIGAFLLQIILIRSVGLGAETDLYIAVQTLPAVWTAVMCACLQGVWLHRFSMDDRSAKGSYINYRNAVSQATLIGFGSSLLFISTSAFWFGFLFPGMRSHDAELIFKLSAFNWGAAALTISFFPCLLMLRVKGLFIKSELMLLGITLISLIATYVALHFWGLVGAAAVFFIKALVINFLYFLLYGVKASATWSRKANPFEAYPDLLKLLAGNSLYKTMPVVDRFLGSLAATGSITSYNLATSGVGAVSALLDRSACAPVIAPFGKMVQAGDYRNFQKSYRSALWKLGVFIGAGFVISLMALGQLSNMFSLLFNASSDAGVQTLTLVLLLTGSLYAAASGTILVAGFYALGDTKTPVIIGIAGFVIGVVLKIQLFSKLGMEGLAAASSLYLLINIFAFLLVLERKVTRRMQHAS
jgi:peptidoglycan biosynthesis protein MviN/MurJ (putative lipid II flippase)